MIKYDVEKNNDVDDEDLIRLKILHQNTKSGFYLQLDNEDNSIPISTSMLDNLSW